MPGLYIDGLQMPDKKNGTVVIIYPNGDAFVEPGTVYDAVQVESDLIDRNALLEKVVEVECNKREGHHFEKVTERVVREQDILSFPTMEK